MHVQSATTMMVAVMPVMPAITVVMAMPVMSAVIAVMAPAVMDGNDASGSDQRDSGKQDCDQHFSDFHIRHFT